MADLNPRIVVEGSQLATERMTRAWKKNRVNARAFSMLPEISLTSASVFQVIDGLNKSRSEQLTDFIVCR
jgi:hypothetical protein